MKRILFKYDELIYHDLFVKFKKIYIESLNEQLFTRPEVCRRQFYNEPVKLHK